MKETEVWSLGQEDPLEKAVAPHSSILAWEILWTEEPGRLESTGSQRVRHNWVSMHAMFLNMYHTCLIHLSVDGHLGFFSVLASVMTTAVNIGVVSFFFPFIFISWRLITLQHCSGFCHTLTWISHGFTCVPHPDPPSRLPPHPIPLGLPSAPALSTCLMHPTWAGDLFQRW